MGRYCFQCVIYRDAIRYFEATVLKCLKRKKNLDPFKHILELDYTNIDQSPVSIRVIELAQFLKNNPEKPENNKLHLQINSLLKFVRNCDGQRVMCIALYSIDGPETKFLVDALPLDFLYAAELPHQATRRLPRPTAFIGGSNVHIAPKFDLVDYIITHCGDSIEQFWRSNVREIVADALATGKETFKSLSPTIPHFYDLCTETDRMTAQDKWHESYGNVRIRVRLNMF